MIMMADEESEVDASANDVPFSKASQIDIAAS